MPLVNAVLYGADDMIGLLVQSRLQRGADPSFKLLDPAPDGRRLFSALGVVRPINGEPTLLGGVVYQKLHTFSGKNVCIEASIAMDHPSWAGRDTLRHIFGYPFNQLGCATLVVQVSRKNKRSRGMVEKLGFKLVGPIPCAFDGKEDICLYAMTRDKCRWLKERNNEQR